VLINLAEDLAEADNRAARDPAKLAEMQALLARIRAGSAP
jgi:hypothetical protein